MWGGMGVQFEYAHPTYGGFLGGSAGKESACNAGDLGSIPGLGRSPEEGKGYPFQYSDLEKSMDCTVHGVTKSRTRLSDFHFHFSARNITGSCQATDASPAPTHPFQQQYKGDHSPSVYNTH